MKRTLLLLLFISIALAASSCDQIVKVEIVIPGKLIPYYDWLLCFPGFKTLPEAPQPIDNQIGIAYKIPDD